MQFNCCILEDENVFAQQLTQHLKTWQNEKDCTLSIKHVKNPALLYGTANNYDIIFIDIILGEYDNGIDVANKLRSNSYTGEIVFLTNFKEYVFDGYPVSALDYLMKPASYDKIKRCMNYVMDKNFEKNFIFRKGNDTLQIPFKNIIYFSSNNHNTQIYTTSGKSYTIRLSFRSIINVLPPQFLRCHRSIIVNIFSIERMNTKEITLKNKTKLPIGGTYLKDFQQKFIDIIQNRITL